MSFSDPLTRVWFCHRTGRYLAVGPRDLSSEEDIPADLRGRLPDAVFGPVNDWTGGECPVDGDQVVRCLFRSRNPYLGAAQPSGFPQAALEAMWQRAPYGVRFNPGSDIIAYQVRVA